MSISNEPVTAVRLNEAQRANAFSKHFGRRLMDVEASIFSMAKALCPKYNGGYWEFYELSNGGFYMAPTPSDKVDVVNVNNGYEGKLSSDAFGVLVCLMAYSALSFKMYEKGDEVTTEALAQHHAYLYDFLHVHPECSELLSAAD